jgi:DNA-directed RNA polymerase specialized sigma24 family protein
VSSVEGALSLASADQVIRCLLTYTDWWQPNTTSVYYVGRAGRDRVLGEGIRPGLLEHLDERSELCQRMQRLSDRDRRLLYLWYLEQRAVDEIAKELKISRRQCFRRRREAIRSIIQAGERDQAA